MSVVGIFLLVLPLFSYSHFPFSVPFAFALQFFMLDPNATDNENRYRSLRKFQLLIPSGIWESTFPTSQVTFDVYPDMESLSQKTSFSLCSTLPLAFLTHCHVIPMDISRLLHDIPQECYTSLLMLLFLQMCLVLFLSRCLSSWNLDSLFFPFLWLVDAMQP